MESWLTCPAVAGSGQKRSTPPRRGETANEVGVFIMSFVYIIQDKISKKYYTGSCLELSKRIARHQRHTGGATTRTGDWTLVTFKKCANLKEARETEKKVKSYKGGNAFKKIINGELAEWSKAPHC